MRGRHGQARQRGWALALPLVALLLVPLAVTPSAAAWYDSEYVRGPLTAATCSTGHVSTATGRLVQGSILGTSLDPIAQVDGATASSSGTGGTVTSADPLSVSALSTINPQLGGVLQFDTGAEAGALRQYAEARPTGWSGASAGSVANAGALDLAAPSPGGLVPRFATLHLGSVLNQLVGGGLGGGITGLADARLDIGALASYATLDGCAADWSGSVYSALQRKYLLAGLNTTLTSPLVKTIETTTNNGATSIRSLVAAVGGNAGLLNSISTATLSALAPTLAAFSVGTPTTTLALDINLTGLATNLATPISDAAGIVSIKLAAGTVTVDLARLLGPGYQNSVGLNGLAPNTQLLLNATAMAALTTAVTTALTTWIAGVGTTVNSAASALDVDLKVSVPISVGSFTAGSVVVSASHVRLDHLIAGTASISAAAQVTGPSNCSGVNALLCATVNPLLATLTSAVTALALGGTLGPIVGNLIKTALTPVPGLASLTSSLTSNATSLVSFLSTALSALFGPSALVSLVVNAQNSPSPAEVSAPPGTAPTWTGLAAPTAHPFRTGTYSVAALRLVTLGVLSGGVAVDLARSSVGPNG